MSTTSQLDEGRDILANYASANNNYIVGANMLMMPVFNDHNYNRIGKKIRVTVEEPVGKYQLFSHYEHEHEDKILYLLTASGRIERISSYFRNDWDEEHNKYVSHRPTESELDEIVPQIAGRFERSMADPTQWALYQDAAIVNRLDECEAHNIPVRKLRDDEQKQREAEAEQERQAERLKWQEKYDARVDEIAGAIEKGKAISVGYNENEFYGKNPVLDLFKLYGIALPLRTQGWVNTGLAEISESGYRYYKSKHKGNSTAFSKYFSKLRDAIRQMPIEQIRASASPNNMKGAIKTANNKLYEVFEAMFPQILSGEYNYMRLESGGFEPLSIERIGDNRISIMHTYTMNGDLMYDPMMTFEVDREARSMTAYEYQMSMPPLYQRVDEDGGGISVDGNGREQYLRNLRMSLNGFASEWFGNIAQQRFKPVRANTEIDGEETEITFDADGNPILPEPEHRPGYEEWSEPASAEEPPYTPGTGVASDDVDAYLPQKTTDKTLEHKLHDRFVELFPQFMNGEYSPLRLEAEHAKPLTLEWVFGDLISISHNYELNGETAFEPLVMLRFNNTEKTLTASSFELSEPPRKDVIYAESGKPNVEMQQNINNLMAQWLDRIEKQGFIPVQATVELDNNGNISKEGLITDKTARIIFDANGNPVLPKPEKPEKQYELGFGFLGNGLTVWNRLEERNGDYVTVAHIATDRTVNYYDKEMPYEVKQRIEAVAKSPETKGFGFAPAPESVPPHIDGTLAPASVHEAVKRVLPETAAASGLDMSLPDPTLTAAEMYEYGYTESDMYPLSTDRAVELFDTGHPIYLLYPDNTESMAFERDEIENHIGLYGIECEDWRRSPVYAAQMAIAVNIEGSREADLLYGDGNRYGIYQIKDGIDELRSFRFTSMSELETLGLMVDRANYELVYTAPFSERIEFLSDRYSVLNRLYEQFNIDHPADFTGHSLSVSDVVVLQWDGQISSHFVDSVGFVEIDGFLGEESQAERADPTYSQVGNKSDAPTVSELDNTVNAGGSISLSDLSQALRNEGKPTLKKGKTSVLGILEDNKQRVAQQSNPESRNKNGLEV